MTYSDSAADFHRELERFALEETDKFGVATVDVFGGAPSGACPTDIMPDCRSVAVFAMKHLEVFTTTDNLPCQAYSQDIVNRETLHQAYRISRFIEMCGFLAFPMVASVSMWPFMEDDGNVAGRISLRHAAQLAGLGSIGRNAMLVTPEFGPRVQLGAILTDASLPPNAPIEENPCDGCDLCITCCPAAALSPPETSSEYSPVKRDKCLEFRRANGGRSPLGYPNACGICRAICPVGRHKKAPGLSTVLAKHGAH